MENFLKGLYVENILNGKFDEILKFIRIQKRVKSAFQNALKNNK